MSILSLLETIETYTEGHETLVLFILTLLAILVIYLFYRSGPAVMQRGDKISSHLLTMTANTVKSLATGAKTQLKKATAAAETTRLRTIQDNNVSNQFPPGSYADLDIDRMMIIHNNSENNIDDNDNEFNLLNLDEAELLAKAFPEWTAQDVAQIVARYNHSREQRLTQSAKIETLEQETQTQAAQAGVALARAEQAEDLLQQYEERRARSLQRPSSFVMLEPEYIHQIQTLTQKTRGLEAELAVCRTAKDRTIRPNEIEGYRQREKDVQAETKRLQKMIEKYQGKLRTEERTCKLVSDQLGQAQRRLRDFRTEVGSRTVLIDRIAATEAQLVDLKVEVETRDSKIQKYEATIEESQTQMTAQESKLEETRNLVSKTDAALRKANDRLVEQGDVLKKYEDSNAMFVAQMQEKEQAVRLLSEKLTGTDFEMKDAAKALKLAKDDVVRADAKLSLLKQMSEAQVARLTDENFLLKAQVTELGTQVKKLETQAADDESQKKTNERIGSLVAEKADLDMQLVKLQAKVDNGQEVAKMKDQRICDLEKQIKPRAATVTTKLDTSKKADGPCENCETLQTKLESAQELAKKHTPTKYLALVNKRDAIIHEQQVQLSQARSAAPKSNNVDPRDIWLEEIRMGLCTMLFIEPGEAQVQPNEHAPSYPHATMLSQALEKMRASRS